MLLDSPLQGTPQPGFKEAPLTHYSSLLAALLKNWRDDGIAVSHRRRAL